MNFGVILAFVAITFISYLFSKDEISTKPTADTSRPIFQQPLPTSSSPDTNKVSNSGKNKIKYPFSNLEDLFREIRMEFEKNLKDGEKEQLNSNIEQIPEREDNNSIGQKVSPLEKNLIKSDEGIVGGIYEGEIGKETCIRFDKKSIVNAIVMSEILQKPKSLRR